eukprot:c16650_g1_i1.p1 GENE.c16650_g1_i1~~c16650_g1_i1.p1  ORF type:complete len:775 (+),score=116.54 c16650_g1_i1:1208-3532(+)
MRNMLDEIFIDQAILNAALSASDLMPELSSRVRPIFVPSDPSLECDWTGLVISDDQQETTVSLKFVPEAAITTDPSQATKCFIPRQNNSRQQSGSRLVIPQSAKQVVPPTIPSSKVDRTVATGSRVTFSAVLQCGSRRDSGNVQALVQRSGASVVGIETDQVTANLSNVSLPKTIFSGANDLFPELSVTRGILAPTDLLAALSIDMLSKGGFAISDYKPIYVSCADVPNSVVVGSIEFSDTGERIEVTLLAIPTGLSLQASEGMTIYEPDSQTDSFSLDLNALSRSLLPRDRTPSIHHVPLFIERSVFESIPGAVDAQHQDHSGVVEVIGDSRIWAGCVPSAETRDKCNVRLAAPDISQPPASAVNIPKATLRDQILSAVSNVPNRVPVMIPALDFNSLLADSTEQLVNLLFSAHQRLDDDRVMIRVDRPVVELHARLRTPKGSDTMTLDVPSTRIPTIDQYSGEVLTVSRGSRLLPHTTKIELPENVDSQFTQEYFVPSASVSQTPKSSSSVPVFVPLSFASRAQLTPNVGSTFVHDSTLVTTAYVDSEQLLSSAGNDSSSHDHIPILVDGSGRNARYVSEEEVEALMREASGAESADNLTCICIPIDAVLSRGIRFGAEKIQKYGQDDVIFIQIPTSTYDRLSHSRQGGCQIPIHIPATQSSAQESLFPVLLTARTLEAALVRDENARSKRNVSTVFVPTMTLLSHGIQSESIGSVSENNHAISVAYVDMSLLTQNLNLEDDNDCEVVYLPTMILTHRGVIHSGTYEAVTFD